MRWLRFRRRRIPPLEETSQAEDGQVHLRYAFDLDTPQEEVERFLTHERKRLRAKKQ